jgi:hypothetical protein
MSNTTSVPNDSPFALAKDVAKKYSEVTIGTSRNQSNLNKGAFSSRKNSEIFPPKKLPAR